MKETEGCGFRASDLKKSTLRLLKAIVTFTPFVAKDQILGTRKEVRNDS